MEQASHRLRDTFLALLLVHLGFAAYLAATGFPSNALFGWPFLTTTLGMLSLASPWFLLGFLAFLVCAVLCLKAVAAGALRVALLCVSFLLWPVLGLAIHIWFVPTP